MNYNTIAKEILSTYPISDPEIQFIRHNENITFKITDQADNKQYLLRIHKPVTEGLFGQQHTLAGVKSEIEILQELKRKNLLRAQGPVANNFGEYITECNLENFNHSCYATLLEWIEGHILTPEEGNLKEIAFAIGESLALFHESLRGIKPSKDFIRPIYDADRINSTIDELKYCVEVNLFNIEQYEIIKKVLLLVKKQANELNLRGNAFGLIHADMQLNNIVVSNGKPCIIDLGFCGFGYYVFDLGSAATLFPSDLRQAFLQGYSSKSYFSFDDVKYIEGQIFMDIFISYALFMRDNERNSWIRDHALETCDNLCKDFLEGKEVFYSL